MLTLKLFHTFSLVSLIHAVEIVNLNGQWQLDEFTGRYKNVAAVVPGGVYSDLIANKIIPDIFYGYNDTETRWVAKTNWNYHRIFLVTSDFLRHSSINLVFDGLDTFATILINGNVIGSSNNMFVRFIFDVKPYLLPGNNSIVVKFESAIEAAQNLSLQSYKIPPDCPAKEYRGECHVNQIRKMQASFGWDWGPAFPSMGIWKSAYLEAYNAASIRYLNADTLEINSDTWLATITTHLSVSKSIQASLIHTLVTDTTSIQEIIPVDLKNTGDLKNVFNLTIPALSIKRWWPNGYGSQSLYNLSTLFKSGTEQHSKSIRIAFRTIELIQKNVTSGMDFYFRVNNMPIFAKGSNEIPLHILPELGQDPELVSKVLETVRTSNMNMLRVWGGGVYESDAFYDKADELGILIWQDFMFACAMYPANAQFLANVETEVRHQVRRLRSHPSIALWAGNNENELALVTNWYGTQSNFSLYKSDYLKLYIGTIKRVLTEEAPSAIFLTSSPTNGRESDLEGFLAREPGSNFFGDVHYYNYILNTLNTATYPIPRFVSEAGYQSMPSVDSWLTATNNLSDLIPSSDFMDHRQHHPLGLVQNNLLINYQFRMNYTSDNLYRSYIYHSQLVQALSMKMEVELYRSFMGRFDASGRGNTMGALYWQLNDVWVAPTWSGIDYTGRWKMLQYFTRDFFAPTIVTGCLDVERQLNIFAISENLSLLTSQLEASLLLQVYNWNSMTPIDRKQYPCNLEFGKSLQITTVDTDNYLQRVGCGSLTAARNNCFFALSLSSNGLLIAPANYVFPAAFRDSNLTGATVAIESVKQLDSVGLSFEITVVTDRIAAFVWLDSHQIAGTFSENGFMQLTAVKVVIFEAETVTNEDVLRKAVTVTHLKDPDWL